MYKSKTGRLLVASAVTFALLTVAPMRSATAGPLAGIAAWLGSSTACVSMAAGLGTATGPGAPLAIPAFYALCIVGGVAATTAAVVAPTP